MAILRNILFIVAGIVITIALLVWVGLQFQPESFAPITELFPQPRMVPLPEGLPEPVERFYERVYGDAIPVIETVVLQGRASLKPFLNIRMPARFIFVHEAGRDYRHYFEAILFGIPVMKVNEGYIDGASFFESPMGTYTDEPNSNQGANLALWAEAMWFPSLWVTDPRVHWEPVDEHTALLYVPFEEGEETLLVRFSPETGLIDMMEAMRYRDIGTDQPKILWILRNETMDSSDLNGVSSVGSVMWLDQGAPWATFNVEELIFNTDVSTLLHQKGH